MKWRMRANVKAITLFVGDKPRAAIGIMCGSKIYRPSDWKSYPLFWRTTKGFGIGPILFWDGS